MLSYRFLLKCRWQCQKESFFGNKARCADIGSNLYAVEDYFPEKCHRMKVKKQKNVGRKCHSQGSGKATVTVLLRFASSGSLTASTSKENRQWDSTGKSINPENLNPIIPVSLRLAKGTRAKPGTDWRTNAWKKSLRMAFWLLYKKFSTRWGHFFRDSWFTCRLKVVFVVITEEVYEKYP